jgi:DNA-binding transcriptional regulator YdaS (Cro superfamily)
MRRMTLAEHVARRGRLSEIGRALGVSHATVWRWARGRVPAERVHSLSGVTGIPAASLRPDLFGPPDLDHAAEPSANHNEGTAQ